MKQYSANLRFQSIALTALSAAVLLSLASVGRAAEAVYEHKPIGDLEIYAPAKPGTATIFMMLDVSGSMNDNSIASDYSGTRKNCGYYSSETITAVVRQRLENDEKGNILKSFKFTPYSCDVGNIRRYGRLGRLQVALIELLSDDVYAGDTTNENKRKTNKGIIADNYEIGIGVFSYEGDGRSGVVQVPTGPLSAEQRINLISEVEKLRATGNTPTAQALAESGAYMMGTTTKGVSYSGFSNSVESSKKNNATYQSPLNRNECSGNGIYLLTDGEPNGSSNTIAQQIMNKSLQGSTLSVNNCNGLPGSSSQAWGCMAEYTQRLRNDNNPGRLPIKTATVGFGKVFDGISGKRNIIVNGKRTIVADCNSGGTQDAKNLCKLGERRGDDEDKTFGDGGFYYTQESQDIANSIVDFASNLVQIINTSPSGTITIPNDPYQAANQLPYAYLPMLDPNIASANSIWKGNLKKYQLNDGTLFGENKQALFKNVAGELKEDTRDLWQKDDFYKGGKKANNDILAGGVYAKLKSPFSNRANVRNVYVEDFSSTTNHDPILRKLSVDASGKPQGFDALVDTQTYTELNKRRLLSFLGFSQVLTVEGQPTNNTLVKNLTLSVPTDDIRILGGVVHSTPAAISYGAKLDDYGRISDNRDDYVLFGSMDGALHIADADSGEESVAIIPKTMMQLQPETLVEDSKTDKVGEPFFGVDAPWRVTADYKYDIAGEKVTIDDNGKKGMFAYGGLRMGGIGFYGIDITKKTDPKILFSITQDGLASIVAGKSTNTGFERLGQVWSRPTAAKIRLKKDDTAPTDVLIFGGGYDMAYEKDDYVAANNQPAKGNAVYMIDAKTGELLWSMSGANGSSKNTKVSSMIHSVVAEVSALDRDNDGLIDHIYVADLGGQVFRVDFENATAAKSGIDAINSFGAKNISQILNTMPAERKFAYRFYERPVISFYRQDNNNVGNQVAVNNGKLFAVVNLISGNRSSPLSKLRSNGNFSNRIYGIIDTDITDVNLYNQNYNGSIKNLTENNLLNLADKLGATATETSKNDAKKEMLNGNKKGWYYPLSRFDGYNNVLYNKGIGDSVVINNILYTTVYNPDKLYGTYSSCAARIVGGSERQLYCLPYGICDDSKSTNGTGGFVPVGQGIQELTLGAYNKDNTDKKVLIGTTSLSDRIEEGNRVDFGNDTGKKTSNIKDVLYPNNTPAPTLTGGDGSAAEYIYNERYTLQPRMWYERN